MAEAIITKEMLEVSGTWVVAISSELNEWFSHFNSCISCEEEDVDIHRSQRWSAGLWQQLGLQGQPANKSHPLLLETNVKLFCQSRTAWTETKRDAQLTPSICSESKNNWVILASEAQHAAYFVMELAIQLQVQTGVLRKYIHPSIAI